MKNLENIKGFEDLNARDQAEISGGYSFWYYFGYGVGKVYKAIGDAIN